MLEDNINLDQLKQDLYKRLVINGDMYTNEVDDAVLGAIRAGDINIPDFTVYGDNSHTYICKNVKHMGYPKIETELSEEESEELQWAWDVRTEAFIEDLSEKYGQVSVVGRSGGYWGFQVDARPLWDLVNFEMDQQTFDNLFDEVVNNLKSNEEWIYDEADIEDEILQKIEDEPQEYITLQPNNKLLGFDKDIEEEAKRWESMDFPQFVSLL